MIDHVCIEVSSKERCREVFEEVLGLKPAYSFMIEKDFMERMFAIPNSCEAVVYLDGNTKIEVFIRPEMEKTGGEHLTYVCSCRIDKESSNRLKRKALLFYTIREMADHSIIYGITMEIFTRSRNKDKLLLLNISSHINKTIITTKNTKLFKR